MMAPAVKFSCVSRHDGCRLEAAATFPLAFTYSLKALSFAAARDRLWSYWERRDYGVE